MAKERNRNMFYKNKLVEIVDKNIPLCAGLKFAWIPLIEKNPKTKYLLHCPNFFKKYFTLIFLPSSPSLYKKCVVQSKKVS